MIAFQDEDFAAAGFLLVFVVVRFIFAGICAFIASGRGRSGAGWFFIGLLFDCFALIVLLVMPDLKKQEEERQRQERENRRLREMIAKDRQVVDTRTSAIDRRLGAHDQALGLDTATETAGQIAGDPVAAAAAGAAAALPPPLPSAAVAEWYYARNGERLGPVQAETIRHLVAAGAIAAGTLVWRHGMADWQPIETVRDFTGGGA